MSDAGDILWSAIKLAAVGTVGYVAYRYGHAVGEESRERQVREESRELWNLRHKVEKIDNASARALAASWNQPGWKPRPNPHSKRRRR